MKVLLDLIDYVTRLDAADPDHWAPFLAAAADLRSARIHVQAGRYVQANESWRCAMISLSPAVWDAVAEERYEWAALMRLALSEGFGGDHPAYRRPLAGPGDTE